MLSLTTKESIILFDMAFYTQVEGVAMESQLESSLANSFLCHHGTKWLNDCPKKFKPVFYKRSVDDIFVLLKKSEHVKLFVDYMNSVDINFSFEAKKVVQMSFLAVNALSENGKFVSNVYRKDTFTGVYTRSSSFLPLEYKFGLVHKLLYRCFCLVPDMSKFHFEIEKCKEVVLSNGYLNKFIDKCSATLYDIFSATFYGEKSGIARLLHNRLLFCKFKIIFKTFNRLKNYFNFKDIVPEPLSSFQINNFTWGSCNASYNTGKFLKGTCKLRSCNTREYHIE